MVSTGRHRVVLDKGDHREAHRHPLIVVLALATALGIGTPEAEALNPNQNTVQGVVNTLYWDLDTFWGKPAQKPGVGYYNYWGNGSIYHYATSCGNTSGYVDVQGFYCNGGHIHFDFTQQSGHLASIGDGAVALWLAHEYAHHAEWLRNINWPKPYHELLADCFAGLYFRYGVYTSGKLNYNDYLEARIMLSRTAATSPSHGGAARRLKAFDYGFQRIGWTSCTAGWQAW